MPDKPGNQRILYVLRHAQAANPPGVGDHDRPLTAKGENDCRRIAGLAAEHAWEPELAVCSTARRTQDTLRLFMAATGFTPDILLFRELYLASLQEILGLLSTMPGDISRLLIVGHNPGLELLVHAADRSSKRPIHLATSSLVRITIDSKEWDTAMLQHSRITGLIQPEH